MRRKIGMRQRVAWSGAVSVTIRDVLQNRGNGRLRSGARQPDARSKADSVGHRDLDVLPHLHVARRFRGFFWSSTHAHQTCNDRADHGEKNVLRQRATRPRRSPDAPTVLKTVVGRPPPGESILPVTAQA